MAGMAGHRGGGRVACRQGRRGDSVPRADRWMGSVDAVDALDASGFTLVSPPAKVDNDKDAPGSSSPASGRPLGNN